MSLSIYPTPLASSYLFPISLSLLVNSFALASIESSIQSNDKIRTRLSNIPTTPDTESDVSSRTETRHHIASFPPTKRGGIAREVRDCPAGFDYQESLCNRYKNLGNYAVWCRKDATPMPEGYPIGQSYIFTGACHAGEVCVDNSSDDYDPFVAFVAFCLSDTNWELYPISKTTLPWHMITGSSVIGLPPTNAGAQGYAVEAQLTDTSKQQSINASSLRIQAQSPLNVHGNWVLKTLPGGTASCTDCDRISIHPVPDGTQSITVDLVSEVVGNLFLSSFVP